MRVETGRILNPRYAARPTCANGHPWTTENTRWRIRADKGETYPTRDCLACKRVSEGKRRRTRIAERTYT